MNASALSRIAKRERERERLAGERLSFREQQILRGIQLGFTNREIAKQLYLHVETVKTHINHVFDKLQVDNRVRAVQSGIAWGYLPCPCPCTQRTGVAS